MALLRSSSDPISLLHDITTQAAAGTRSSEFPFNTLDIDRCTSVSTITTYEAYDEDEDDEYSYSSFCESGFMSTSTSLTSISTSSSTDEIPTRPSSSQGWNFDGVWSVGEMENLPKPPALTPLPVRVDAHGDPAESTLTDSPFLIAQYVAHQLRTGIEEDFVPWSPIPDPQTPTPQTPKLTMSTQLKGPAMQRYAELIRAMELQSPNSSTAKSPSFRSYRSQSMPSPLPPTLPTIMITAPSSEQATPVIDNEMEMDLLTLQYSPRPRQSSEQWHRARFEWGGARDHNSDADSDGSEYDDDEVAVADDDDLALSHVKKTLQASRRPANNGLTGRVLGFFNMRK